jgi:hypothetical protein
VQKPIKRPLNTSFRTINSEQFIQQSTMAYGHQVLHTGSKRSWNRVIAGAPRSIITCHNLGTCPVPFEVVLKFRRIDRSNTEKYLISVHILDTSRQCGLRVYSSSFSIQSSIRQLHCFYLLWTVWYTCCLNFTGWAGRIKKVTCGATIILLVSPVCLTRPINSPGRNL